MEDDGIAIELNVNAQRRRVRIAPDTPLMYVLRNDLGLKGVRTGCSIGECGACRVIVDGTAVPSCITPVSDVAGGSIVTPEGLGGPADPHPVQQAFIDRQAAQCGYCVNGMIMSVAAHLDDTPSTDADNLRHVLDEHICRCGTQVRLLGAACRAAGLSADSATTVVTDTSDTAPEEPGDLPAALVAEPQLSRWVTVTEDGRVLARPGKVELGQGVRTAFAQVVAAYVGIPFERVDVLPTATGRSPDQGNTSGSFSIDHGGTALAMAATALRRVLSDRGAKLLGCSVADVELDAEGVLCRDGQRIGFDKLLSLGPITELVEASDRPRWASEQLGRSVPRTDLQEKLTGSAAYVHDLDLDGMLHARILLPPAYDARATVLDLDAARRLPGVREIVQQGRFALVLADREEQAIRAVRRLDLDTQWETRPGFGPRRTADLLRDLPGQEYVRRRDDGVPEALTAGHAASYSRPYQLHGPMSPSAAVAVSRDSTLTVWTHSQGVYPLRRELAAVLDMAEDTIVLEHSDGPGCYGMNGADDAAAFAAIAALAVPGHPVRFQFSIADEFAWEPYGPGMVADLRAALSPDGTITAWSHRGITDSHSTRPNGDGNRLMAAWLGQGVERPWVGLGEPGLRNALPPYDIPALDVSALEVRGPLRTGPLRSLGAFHNVFAAESFMDELAEIAGADPVEFRLRHLRDSRSARVLEVAAEVAGWERRVGPSGRGLGVALARYKDVHGYAAEIAEVRVDTDSGEIEVLGVVVVCDVGTVINPDGLRNQLEGGVVQGLSRTMLEELHLGEHGTVERDWTTYGTLRFSSVPHISVVLVNRPGLPPLGVGEVSTPLVPAAVANAIDDAIGIRLRDLPLTPQRLRQRLEDLDDQEMARVLI